jgi:hypothetical protein
MTRIRTIIIQNAVRGEAQVMERTVGDCELPPVGMEQTAREGSVGRGKEAAGEIIFVKIVVCPEPKEKT